MIAREHIGLRSVEIFKDAGFRGRHGDVLHELLGVHFVGFDPGALLGRAKAENPRFANRVAQALSQGRFRAYDHELDGVGFGKGDQAFRIVDRDVHALSPVASQAGIARRGIEGVASGRLHHFPPKSMFASAAANQKYVHRCILILIVSVRKKAISSGGLCVPGA